MEWLKAIAPTLATAIAGPFGTMAYGLAATALGVSPAEAQKTIESGKLTSEQISAVQLADVSLKARAQELGLDFAKLAVDDRKSARDMQISNKSWLPSVLAVLIIGGFGAVTALKVMGYAVATDPTVQDCLTTLRDAVLLVLSFYFGSSSGSQAKDDLLHKSSPMP